MLVNLTPNLKAIDSIKSFTKEYNYEYIPQSDESLMLEKGIYRDNVDFNFGENEFLEKSEKVDVYGVADNLEQIKEYLKKYIDDLNEKYIISVTPVFQDKSNEGKRDGWRWHKWGPYIGKLKPQYEYLDDEYFGDDFNYVLTFDLIKVI